MPESIRPEKNILAFNQGLNTESSEIAFPDGFTTDERNYELLLDGSRRRRKGLAQESGGAQKTLFVTASVDHESTFVWTNVGGDPEKTFIVHHLGTALFFTDDAETISTTFHADEISLAGLAYVNGGMSGKPVQMTSGRGNLIVTSEGMCPIVVEWDSATDEFTTTCIYPQIRDYSDQNDGWTNLASPSTLSDETRYNLMNRGWRDADLTAYNSAEGSYPNKSVHWKHTYKRVVDESTAATVEQDGTKVFDSARYAAEPASAATTQKGSLIISPEDSTFALNEAGDSVGISTWTYVDNGDDTWNVIITTDSNHGLVDGDTFEIRNMSSLIKLDFGMSKVQDWDGSYTVDDHTGTSATTRLECVFTVTSLFSSMTTQYRTLGSITIDEILTRPNGSALNVGPTTCAFHDGRLFQAGIKDNEWSDYIFFSQIPDDIDKLRKCYQVADPTDPENNQLVDTDGGYLVIQGIQGVKRMLSVRNMLLVFAENGVWEIGGGQRGFFTPSGYSVRKLTDVGCNAPNSPISFENIAVFTGPEGIYTISPNQYTGILEATSISMDLIQSKWNAITKFEQKRVFTVYDGAKKRLWFFYGKTAATPSGNTGAFYYTKALILHMQIPAWTYYEYNSDTIQGIITCFAISNTDSTDQANKLKFVCAPGGATNADIIICDHDQTDYIDFDGAESPLPYATTGWDNLGDFQRRRQAPIVTVYSKRTETGYTDGGAGWSGDNESSTKMTAFWDWTEAKQYTSTARTAQEDWDGTGDATKPSVSGKIDDQQQVYRHTRAFTPANAGDVDGYPVVVTRNKVRGRGRVLQLRFDGEATKDSHIMGFTVNYRAQRAV